MNEHENPADELSRIYRDAAQPEPSPTLDDAILAAARDAAGARPQALPKKSFANRWRVPFALAATVVLSVAVTTMVREEQSAGEVAFPPPTADAVAQSKVTGAATQPAKSPPHFSTAGPVAKPAYEPAPVVRESRQAEADLTVPMASRADKAEQAASFAQDTRGELAADAARSSRAKVAEQAAPAIAAAPMPASSALEKRDTSSRLQADSTVGASVLMNKSPEEWIVDIRALKHAGRRVEAAEKLADFRKVFPSYKLPDDLK